MLHEKDFKFCAAIFLRREGLDTCASKATGKHREIPIKNFPMYFILCKTSTCSYTILMRLLIIFVD